MLWVYGHYIFFNSFSAVTVFRRQNLTSLDVRFKFLTSKDGPCADRGKSCMYVQAMNEMNGVLGHLCAHID